MKSKHIKAHFKNWKQNYNRSTIYKAKLVFLRSSPSLSFLVRCPFKLAKCMWSSVCLYLWVLTGTLQLSSGGEKSRILVAYEYVTRMQGFLSTEQWAGADDVDHATWVTSHFFHQQWKVMNLGLKVIDQWTLNVQQSCGIRIMILQFMHTLFHRWVITVLFFALLKDIQTPLTTVKVSFKEHYTVFSRGWHKSLRLLFALAWKGRRETLQEEIKDAY